MPLSIYALSKFSESGVWDISRLAGMCLSCCVLAVLHVGSWVGAVFATNEGLSDQLVIWFGTSVLAALRSTLTLLACDTYARLPLANN